MPSSPINPPRSLTTIVALITMIGPFTIDCYLPSFPAIEADFGISRALLSQSLAFYLAAFALSTLFLGPLSDRLGRKTVILSSLLCYVTFSIGSALSSDYSTFLLFRILQGVAAGGSAVAGRAIIRDVYSPQDAQKAMSRVMMVFALAPAIAPIIGGWLQDFFGWQSVFYFLAIYGSLIILLVFFRVPETLLPEQRQSFLPRNVARVYGRTLSHRRFLSLTFIGSCYFSGLFMYIAGAPTLIFDFLQLGSGDFAVMFIPMVCGLMIGSGISGWLAQRWAMERTIKLALGVMICGSTVNVAQTLLLEPMVITSVLPLSLFTCGIGIAMPSIAVLSLDCFPRNRGTASALMGFVQMMGNALIVSVVVPILSHEASHLALGQFTLLLVALLLWWRIPAASTQHL